MKILIRQVHGRKKAPNWSAIAQEVERTMEKVVKPSLLESFKVIVAGWEHKPEFKARKYVHKGAIEVAVYPAGEYKKIWRYVSEGTRPHKIRVKNAKALAFVWGGPGSYNPKTTTRPSWGGPGTVTGGKMTYRQEVDHPGTEARNFEKLIVDKYKPQFRRHIENAMRRGARRANR